MGDHFDFLQVNSSCGVSFGSATCLAMCKLVNKKWKKKKGREGGSGVVRVVVVRCLFPSAAPPVRVGCSSLDGFRALMMA